MKELGIENPGKKTDDRDNHSQEGMLLPNPVSFPFADSLCNVTLAKPIKSNLWLWRISGSKRTHLPNTTDPKLFANTSTTQTDAPSKILTASFGAQIDISPNSISTQTDAPTPRVTTEAEIQADKTTDSRSHLPQEDDKALASSSSTVHSPP
jgi:hypothetical protein